MPRLRRGVELNASELAWLARALTVEQRYALIDAGWGDDLDAAVDFAMRHLPELRELWEARLERVPPGLADGLLQTLALTFWDQAVPVLVANPRVPYVPQDDAPGTRYEVGSPGERSVTSGESNGNRGGRKLKKHPGIALHEAAHLIGMRKQEKPMSNVEIATTATDKARRHPEISTDVIAAYRWQAGMLDKDVAKLRQAITDRLVQVKGGAILVRSKRTEAWLTLHLVDWHEIPQLEVARPDNGPA